jgi:transcription elongation factor GreA
MNPNQEYLTKEKHNELQKELELLKTVKRKEIAESLEYAKSLGDLSENQEYQEARDAQAVLEDRISHLENVLKKATIVSTSSSGKVSVGSVVTVEKEGGSSRTFTIVGSEEADATTGKISMKSPLGAATLGKSKGESFSFETPSGIVSMKIVDID